VHERAKFYRTTRRRTAPSRIVLQSRRFAARRFTRSNTGSAWTRFAEVERDPRWREEASRSQRAGKRDAAGGDEVKRLRVKVIQELIPAALAQWRAGDAEGSAAAVREAGICAGRLADATADRFLAATVERVSAAIATLETAHDSYAKGEGGDLSKARASRISRRSRRCSARMPRPLALRLYE